MTLPEDERDPAFLALEGKTGGTADYHWEDAGCFRYAVHVTGQVNRALGRRAGTAARMSRMMRTATLPTLGTIPALGQGTWYFGENPARRDEEIAALQHGISLGLTLIDTAEMYGNGASELLVGEAIRGHRDEITLVSKVLPSNASLRGTRASCEASLQRLGTDHLDLYLIHWRGGIPLAESVAAMEALVSDGLVRAWGVSNFDTDDMRELSTVPGGERVEVNQVLYNLARRGPEFDLLPYCATEGIGVMSYSPVDHGDLVAHPAVIAAATLKGVTATQLALAWVLRRAPEMSAVVKASSVAHVSDNRAAADISFTDAEIAALDDAFRPPRRAEPLEML
jgi:diketogulonate reductase-like aldo/keto reductase